MVWIDVCTVTQIRCKIMMGTETNEADVPMRKPLRVSGWDATHWRRARALHTRFEAAAVNDGGERRG